jgi:hypothetical protein
MTISLNRLDEELKVSAGTLANSNACTRGETGGNRGATTPK